MKELLLGNEAVARGLYEAGCGIVSSYPGTPSTEITEAAAKYPEIYAGMCFNTCVLKTGEYEDAPHGEEDTTYLLPAADEVGDFCFCPAYYEDQAALEEYSAALHHDGKKNAAEK